MAWTDGDFKLFATGLAIGGQWNLGEVKAGDVVECWNDDGVYDYFYVKFKKAINPFSYGQFVNTVKVYSISSDTYLPVSGVTRLDGTTCKVNCDISKENSGVIVIGLPTSYLTYTSGSAVQKFISMFYVNGIDRIVTYAYLWENIGLSFLKFSSVLGNPKPYMYETTSYNPKENISLCGKILSANDSVEVSYFDV